MENASNIKLVADPGGSDRGCIWSVSERASKNATNMRTPPTVSLLAGLLALIGVGLSLAEDASRRRRRRGSHHRHQKDGFLLRGIQTGGAARTGHPQQASLPERARAEGGPGGLQGRAWTTRTYFSHPGAGTQRRGKLGPSTASMALSSKSSASPRDFQDRRGTRRRKHGSRKFTQGPSADPFRLFN